MKSAGQCQLNSFNIQFTSINKKSMKFKELYFNVRSFRNGTIREDIKLATYLPIDL